MAATESTMIALGTPAPDFSLPDINGNIVKRDDFSGAPALLAAFICNHCPYVVHIRPHLVELIRDYQAKGIAVVAINSNDAETYPEDSHAKMKEYARQYGYTFPYLYDETQEVAKAYAAACTPDFFLFDCEQKLVYRGQMDASRPRTDIPVTGKDLRAALDAVLEGREVPIKQMPSMGCNIKWKT